MKIFIVATYDAMVSPIKKLIEKYDNIDIDYGVGILEDGLKLALEAKNRGYEAIISRGGTARLIKKHMDIPVIDAKPSGNDLLKSILIAKNNDFKTSIIAYSNITDGAAEIIDLLNLDYKVHYIKNNLDISALLINLKDEGYEQILGDSLAIKLANDLNFKTVLFQTSYDTLENFLGYTIMILNQTKKINEIDLIRSRFLMSTINDYCIIVNNKIIYSNFENFEKIPVSYEKCINLIYDLEEMTRPNKEIIAKVDGIKIRVSSTNISGKKYYLFEFKRAEEVKNLPNGIYEFEIENGFIPVLKSEAMKLANEKSKELAMENEPIFILEDNEYTLNEILGQMIKINNRETILVDYSVADMKSFEEISKLGRRNIIIKNIKEYEDLKEVISRSITNEGMTVVLLDKNSKLLDYIDPKRAIIVPSAKERREDLINIFNNYIGHYHERYGTSALKIQDELFEEEFLLEKNLDELLETLRNAIFEENRVLITKENYLNYFENFESISMYQDITLDELEKEVILYQLEKEEYNQSKVSEILGISRSTLWRKMKKYDV